jgi:hypothetical protein
MHDVRKQVTEEEGPVMVETPRDKLDAIWERIDEADQISDRARRRDAVTSAIADLQRLADAGFDGVWYALGYAFYIHPDRALGTKEAECTERCLRRAIEKGVEPDLSRLYLAYHYYDLGEYDASLNIARQVDKTKLDESMEIRCVELELCGELKVRGLLNSQQRLAEYAVYIDSLETPDIPPLMLMNTLEGLATAGELPASLLNTLEKLDRAYPILSSRWFRQLLEKKRGQEPEKKRGQEPNWQSGQT